MYIHIHTERETYHKESPHMAMDTEMSTSCWRPRKARGGVQVQKPHNQGGQQCHSSSESEGKQRPFQLNSQEEKANSFLPPPFSSIQALLGLDDATTLEKTIYLFQSTDSDVIPFRNTLTDTLRNNAQPNIWALCGLVKQSIKLAMVSSPLVSWHLYASP